MPSTPESLLRAELQATGENATTWGIKTNNNIELLAEAIAGVANINVGGSGNYTLVASNYVSDEARPATLVLTGTLSGNRDVIVPSSPKHYTIINQTSGAFPLTIRQLAGTGVGIPAGSSQIVCTSTTCVGVGINNVLRAGDTMTGALGVIAGTAAEPGVFVSGNTNTGLFQPAANTLAVTVGGAEVARFGANGLQSAAPWVDLASAATTDLGAQTSDNLRITGTTTITSFGTAANGVTRHLRFAGALTLTHNVTSLILPGLANIITAAGDTATAISLGSGTWVVVDYQRAAGLPIGQIATARVLGRRSAGTGAIEDIPVGNDSASLSLGINRGTAQATTSGTAVDFTAIPIGVRRITLLLRGVSISGTDNYLIQIGAGSFLTSGYVSQAQGLRDNATPVNALSTAGFILSADTNSAARVFTGRVTLYNITGNIWTADGVLVATDGIRSAISSGEVTLSGDLDRVRLALTGSNTFDLGQVNLLWEF